MAPTATILGMRKKHLMKPMMIAREPGHPYLMFQRGKNFILFTLQYVKMKRIVKLEKKYFLFKGFIFQVNGMSWSFLDSKLM